MIEQLQQVWIERRILVISIAVVLILALIIGIGFLFISNSRSSSTQAPLETPEVTLTWWKIGYDNAQWKDVLKEFTALPGNNKVTFDVVKKENSTAYYRDLIADIARGIGPDIFTLQNTDLPAYKEFLSPNNVFRGSTLTRYRDDFVNLAVRDTMDKDTVYCVTHTVDTLQLYYNETLLQQNQISRPATTWNDIERQIPFLRRASLGTGEFIQSPIALGTGGRSPEGKETNIQHHGDIVSALIFQFGGQLYDYQLEKSVFGQNSSQSNETPSIPTFGTPSEQTVDTTSASYKAISFYNSFTDPNNSRYSWNRANPDSEEMFVQGRLAYMIGYRSLYDSILAKNPRINVSVNQLPQFNEQNARTYGTFSMDCLNSSLASQSLNQRDPIARAKYQKAQEFQEFISRKEQQITLANSTKLPAAHKDAIALQLQGDKMTKIFAQGALNAESYYQPDVLRVSQMWSTLFEKVQYSNIPLENATNEAIKEYNAILTAKPKLRT